MEIQGQYCYYFSDYGEYWHRIVPICEDMGATLASIHSQEEQDYVSNRMLALDKITYYIGFRKQECK